MMRARASARSGSPAWAAAIRGYPRLLTVITDITRLSMLARDRRRHAFLLRATGSDYAALTEIRTAQSLIADQRILDLQVLVELTAYRHAAGGSCQAAVMQIRSYGARAG